MIASISSMGNCKQISWKHGDRNSSFGFHGVKPVGHTYVQFQVQKFDAILIREKITIKINYFNFYFKFTHSKKTQNKGICLKSHIFVLFYHFNSIGICVCGLMFRPYHNNNDWFIHHRETHLFSCSSIAYECLNVFWYYIPMCGVWTIYCLDIRSVYQLSCNLK